jgi:quercetin dioxygenase-like cupin family protein
LFALYALFAPTGDETAITVYRFGRVKFWGPAFDRWHDLWMTEPPVLRTILFDHHLGAAAQVSHVEVRRITIAPSTVGGAHRHNGSVFGTIESGSLVFQVGTEPETVLRVGDVFYEPADVVISKFDATSEGVMFLGYFLLETGQAPEITFVA